MEIENNKKLVIFLLGAILLFIFAGYFLFFMDSKDKKVSTQDGSSSDFKVETKELPTSAFPVGIPKDLPVQVGSRTLQNYEASTNDGRLQSTRKLTTKLSPEEALKTYVEFFEGRNWLRASSGKLVSPVILNYKEDLLTIAVSKDSTSGTIVDITLLQHKNN